MNEQLRRSIFELEEIKKELSKLKDDAKTVKAVIESMYPLKKMDKFSHGSKIYYFSHAEYTGLNFSGDGVRFHVYGFKIKKNNDAFINSCYVTSETIK